MGQRQLHSPMVLSSGRLLTATDFGLGDTKSPMMDSLSLRRRLVCTMSTRQPSSRRVACARERCFWSIPWRGKSSRMRKLNLTSRHCIRGLSGLRRVSTNLPIFLRVNASFTLQSRYVAANERLATPKKTFVSCSPRWPGPDKSHSVRWAQIHR